MLDLALVPLLALGLLPEVTLHQSVVFLPSFPPPRWPTRPLLPLLPRMQSFGLGVLPQPLGGHILLEIAEAGVPWFFPPAHLLFLIVVCVCCIYATCSESNHDDK